MHSGVFRDRGELISSIIYILVSSMRASIVYTYVSQENISLGTKKPAVGSTNFVFTFRSRLISNVQAGGTRRGRFAFDNNVVIYANMRRAGELVIFMLMLIKPALYKVISPSVEKKSKSKKKHNDNRPSDVHTKANQ